MIEGEKYNISTNSGLILRAQLCVSKMILSAAMREEDIWGKWYTYGIANGINLKSVSYYKVMSLVDDTTRIIPEFDLKQYTVIEKSVLKVSFYDIGSIEELRYLLSDKGYNFKINVEA